MSTYAVVIMQTSPSDTCGQCAAFAHQARKDVRKPPGFGVCAHLPQYRFVSPHKGCHIEPPRFRARVQRSGA